jgi:hypothetical protein
VKEAVITINAGRGFIVNYLVDRLVVTAAHCLPWLPPCGGALDLGDRTYRALLAPLGREPAVWAGCLFVDPVADVAVLGSPDNQEFFKEAKAYEELVESVTPIPIADAPSEGEAWLLSLDANWFRCSAEYINDGPLWLSDLEQPMVGGMSGSPIIAEDGKAIGIATLGDPDNKPGPGTPNARFCEVSLYGYCGLFKTFTCTFTRNVIGKSER